MRNKVKKSAGTKEHISFKKLLTGLEVSLIVAMLTIGSVPIGLDQLDASSDSSFVVDDGTNFSLSEGVSSDAPPQGSRLVSVSISGKGCTQISGSQYTVKESDAQVIISCNLGPLGSSMYELNDITDSGVAFGLECGTIHYGKIMVKYTDSKGVTKDLGSAIEMTSCTDPAVLNLSKDLVDGGVTITVYAMYSLRYIDHYDWSARQATEMAAAGLFSPLAIGAAIYAANNSPEQPVYGYKGVMETSKLFVQTDDARSTVIRNISIGSESDDIIHKTATLSSGAITVTGFEVDNSLNPYNRFEVYRDGALVSGKMEQNGVQHTIPGHYWISVYGPFSSKVTYEVDVIDVDKLKDKLCHILDSDPILTDDQMEKVLQQEDMDSEVFFYEEGCHIIIPDEIPAVQEVEVYHDGNKVEISDPLISGYYDVYLTIGKNSGDIIRIKSSFGCTDSSTIMTLNEKLLKRYISTLQSAVEAYSYEIESNGVGKVLVLSESYDKVLGLAKSVELSKVVINKGTGEDSESYTYRGVTYYNSGELQDALLRNAKLAISLSYMPTKGITIEDESVLEDLVSRNLKADVYVSLDERSSNEVVFTQPYAYLSEDDTVSLGNTDFTFTSDMDDYNISDSIELVVDGKSFPIAYDRSIFSQFNELNLSSGTYSIRESLNGKVHTYSFEYYSADEVPSVSICTQEGVIIVSSGSVYTIIGDYSLKLDRWSVATVVNDSQYSRTISQHNDVVLSESCSVVVHSLNGHDLRFVIKYVPYVPSNIIVDVPHNEPVEDIKSISPVTDGPEVVSASSSYSIEIDMTTILMAAAIICLAIAIVVLLWRLQL